MRDLQEAKQWKHASPGGGGYLPSLCSRSALFTPAASILHGTHQVWLAH